MPGQQVETLEVVLERRRGKFSSAVELGDDLVLIFSGPEVEIPGGLDTRYPFVEHPDFRWLTEARGPGHVLAYDPREGWTEFLRRPSMDDKIWTGALPLERGRSVEEFSGWLQERSGRAAVTIGSPTEKLPGIQPSRLEGVAEMAWHVRRAKDPYAIAEIRKAVEATAAGFKAVREFIEPGRSEKEIAAEMLYNFMRAGADALAFSTLVGTGSNSAVLHFSPSDRVVRPGDWVLVDAGASREGYVGDVTRMFSAQGTFEGAQKELYDMLLAAQVRAIARCQPGVEWVDVHRATARDIAAGLIDLGVLRGSADAAVETGAVGVFFPHGIGHMFGLGVRDASGHSPDREGLAVVAMARPRCNFVLQPGYSMTVEPGVYFIPPYLEQQRAEGKFRDQINYDLALGSFAEIGGLRIEDNIIVGQPGQAPEVLTAAIPK